MKLFGSKLLQQVFADPIATRGDLFKLIQDAAAANIFDKDSLPLIEAVLQFGDMRAKDILLPRHEVDVIDVKYSFSEVIALIERTGHSRFPVIDTNINDIIGIFHSKDIVQYFLHPHQFDLLNLVRKPLFVPEIKPLDSLLYEMRLKQSHLAIVVDEFTNVAGIVTLEMIVEQIIGEIDDEHDSIDGEHGVVELQPGKFRVKGYCGLEQFNNIAKTEWQDDKVESVGGYITKWLGRIPKTGEELELEGCQIQISHADSRKINSLTISTPND